MEIGELDTRVVILRRSDVRETKFRTDRAVWLPMATVWAKVEEILPGRSGQIADGVDIERGPCRIWMRWRGDVTGEMRLQIPGRDGEYRIVAGPKMIGRRRWIELTAETVSTEGQRP